MVRVCVPAEKLQLEGLCGASWLNVRLCRSWRWLRGKSEKNDELLNTDHTSENHKNGQTKGVSLPKRSDLNSTNERDHDCEELTHEEEANQRPVSTPRNMDPPTLVEGAQIFGPSASDSEV